MRGKRGSIWGERESIGGKSPRRTYRLAGHRGGYGRGANSLQKGREGFSIINSEVGEEKEESGGLECGFLFHAGPHSASWTGGREGG